MTQTQKKDMYVNKHQVYAERTERSRGWWQKKGHWTRILGKLERLWIDKDGSYYCALGHDSQDSSFFVKVDILKEMHTYFPDYRDRNFDSGVAEHADSVTNAFICIEDEKNRKGVKYFRIRRPCFHTCYYGANMREERIAYTNCQKKEECERTKHIKKRESLLSILIDKNK